MQMTNRKSFFLSVCYTPDNTAAGFCWSCFSLNCAHTTWHNNESGLIFCGSSGISLHSFLLYIQKKKQRFFWMWTQHRNMNACNSSNPKIQINAKKSVSLHFYNPFVCERMTWSDISWLNGLIFSHSHGDTFLNSLVGGKISENMGMSLSTVIWLFKRVYIILYMWSINWLSGTTTKTTWHMLIE